MPCSSEKDKEPPMPFTKERYGQAKATYRNHGKKQEYNLDIVLYLKKNNREDIDANYLVSHAPVHFYFSQLQ